MKYHYFINSTMAIFCKNNVIFEQINYFYLFMYSFIIKKNSLENLNYTGTEEENG